MKVSGSGARSLAMGEEIDGGAAFRWDGFRFDSSRGTGVPARSRRWSIHSYSNDEAENSRRGRRIVDLRAVLEFRREEGRNSTSVLA